MPVPISRSQRAPAAAGKRQPRRLRVVLCTRGGLFGTLVLRRLRTCDRIEVCGIVRSSRVFHPGCGFLSGSLALVRRSGVAYALYLWCATTLADALCSLTGAGRVPARARPGGEPVHTTRNVNDAGGLQFLSDCAPDVLVSAFFDQRLEPRALAIPTLACLNVHPSVLPAFKGVDPVLQPRLHGADTGVSVHAMNAELDAGAIFAQRAVPIPKGASIFGATELLFREGAELLVGVIDKVQHGDAGDPQSKPGSYQSWPSRADIRALHQTGGALIRLSDLKGIFARTALQSVGRGRV